MEDGIDSESSSVLSTVSPQRARRRWAARVVGRGRAARRRAAKSDRELPIV